jgi:predicted phosphohydrolase
MSTATDGILLPNGITMGQAFKKAAVETWIKKTIEGDVALKRGNHNYSDDPVKTLKKVLPELKKQGIAVYVGAGNIIMADLKCDEPFILHRRPLAQRYVTLAPEIRA